ncbi:Vesicle-mediated ER to Golgi transport protein [Vanrija albida]|uniref:Vesicle-mediated ER to Golgi transport protein n=1 Tax=Vanrija albida TaxID=181172 RepID=A0ABR3QB70_9TREE
MSLFGTRFSSAVTALRGELSAAPQTANETITKLVDKIQTSPSVDDRRTAVLGLKGLSRDWKAEVGREALPSLIAVLVHDSPHDVDIAKAVLETLMSLCETAEKPAKDDVGLHHTDQFLETPEPFHAVLQLLSVSPAFFPRFYALQFLQQLLTARATLAQSYVLSAPPPGVDGVLTVLDPKAPAPGQQPGERNIMGGGAGEMLRNEALLLLPTMLAGNADLQKIVAFSGAFEKTLDIITSEDGIEGGIVVQDSLAVIGQLLRFNVSNQNLFRELSLIPSLPPILHFPTPLAPDAQAPDAFALQDWPEQKLYNAGLVLGLIRTLVGGPGGGNQSAMANGGVTRSLLELSLASNAPNGLKCQALNTLTPIMLSSVANQGLLSTLMISALVPVHADEEHPNGGFIRLPPKPAVVQLVSTVIEGDPSAGGRGLRGRAAGVNMFEAYVSGNDDARIGIISSMIAPPQDNPNANYPDEPQSAGSIILSGLLDLHTSDGHFDPYRPLFSCLLLSHLLRNSEHAKKLARDVSFPSGDGDEDSDDRVSLVQLVVGNLIMASRAQEEAANRQAKGDPGSASEEEDWTRVMVGYLVLLCSWLWDSPKTVKEFLSESGNLQVLIVPITQPTGIDPLVQGLCAFLLGVCYEFNREPGEVTRATLHPILHSRIGPDQFVSRMARLREDPRFRAVQPDAFDTEGDNATDAAQVQDNEEEDEGLELWFDWAFVDFWKNHYYTIQRSIAVDPDAVRGAVVDDSEQAEIIMSLRSKLKAQTEEVVNLQKQLSSSQEKQAKEKDQLVSEIDSLTEQVATLGSSLEKAQSGSSSHSAELDTLRSDLAAAREQVTSSLAESAAHAETRQQLEATRAELDTARTDLKTAQTELASVSEKLAAKPGKGKGNSAELDKLKARVKELEEELEAEKSKENDDTEHEDLLVLLEELSQKRKRDKKIMRDKGLDVSDDEDDDDDE